MPRHKVKTRPRPKLKVLPGGFTPIEITREMIDLIIVAHATQDAYTDCLRGHCAKAQGAACLAGQPESTGGVETRMVAASAVDRAGQAKAGRGMMGVRRGFMLQWPHNVRL